MTEIRDVYSRITAKIIADCVFASIVIRVSRAS